MHSNETRFHDNQSREGRMSSIEADLASEMQQIARKAAEPVPAGETVKGQMGRAWEALGRPAWWRLRAAWQGYAGAWRGRAIEDFRRRDAERRRKGEALSGQASELSELYTRIAEGLRTKDADFYGADITRLLDAARALGARPRAVDRPAGD